MAGVAQAGAEPLLGWEATPAGPAAAAAGAARVLHVSRVGFLGGVERVMLTLAAGRGGAGAILGPGGGELERAAAAAGIPFLPAPVERSRITASPAANLAYPARWARAARAIDAACAAWQPDVLHVHHPATVLQSAWAARRRGIPILFHVHEIGPARAAYRAALAVALRLAARVVCVSGPGLDLARSAGAPGRVVARVLHNGVDPGFERRADGARAAEVEGPGPHIGVFGVLEPRKGQDVALAALAAVRAAHPGARLWLVGGAALADKAGYVERLRMAAAAPALGGAVAFAGHRGDVAAWMRAMDVVVLPSVAHESLSMALIEALTLGRPVVATRVGGAAEAVTDGATGLLVPPGDPAALAAAILRALGPEGAALGAAARRDAAARFSSASFRARVGAVYDDLRGAA